MLKIWLKSLLYLSTVSVSTFCLAASYEEIASELNHPESCEFLKRDCLGKKFTLRDFSPRLAKKFHTNLQYAGNSKRAACSQPNYGLGKSCKTLSCDGPPLEEYYFATYNPPQKTLEAATKKIVKVLNARGCNGLKAVKNNYVKEYGHGKNKEVGRWEIWFKSDVCCRDASTGIHLESSSRCPKGYHFNSMFNDSKEKIAYEYSGDLCIPDKLVGRATSRKNDGESKSNLISE